MAVRLRRPLLVLSLALPDDGDGASTRTPSRVSGSIRSDGGFVAWVEDDTFTQDVLTLGHHFGSQNSNLSLLRVSVS